VIDYLLSLGITAVELMPVHQFIHDRHLVDRGLSNYWGYNTLNYFAPHADYTYRGDKGQQVTEFRTMVRNLHREGIEVILDVVYNHTGEGSHLGPTLSLRGIDNASYYRLVPDNKRYYYDYTGTGNTLNMMHPPGPAAHHGQPAILGPGDACGRVPVRSRRDPCQGTPRSEQALGLL
jgi:glycogen operon protein